MARDHRVLEAGAQIALGWPNAFHVLATEIRAAYSKKGRLSQQYGQLHRLVASSGAPGFIRDAYANHLRAREDAGELDWPLFLPKPPEAVGSVTRSEARQMLGLGGNSFAKLLKTEMWGDVEVVLSTREGLEYRRADVQQLKVRLDRLVSPSVLDERLGLGSKRGESLCNSGLLKTVPWNRHSKNSVKISVDIADAMELFERVCSLGLGEQPKEPVSFATLARSAANRQIIRFGDLMHQVARGRPKSFRAYPDRPGFDGLVFEKSEAIEVLEELSEPDCQRLGASG